LYHFNTIRWLNEYPLVPGLGNLHGRLAYNQSFFTYAASVNFYPLFHHGHNVANSFLLLLFLAECLHALFVNPEEESGGKEGSSAILFLPLHAPVLAFIVVKNNLSSPTPIRCHGPSPSCSFTILHGMPRCECRCRCVLLLIILILSATAITTLNLLVYASAVSILSISLLGMR
jgi:hypothetical protein